jgi:L-ribulose-5-phosphate 3-epimerase
MIKLKNFGFMQGRLSPSEKNKIQFFPKKNWKKEFFFAKQIGLKNMEWTLDHKNLYKNPIFTKNGKKKIKELSKKYNITIKSLTGDCFMQKPFWKYKKKSKYIQDLKKIIKACSDLEIKYIIFPLVDNSSIKNKNEEREIVFEFKKLNKFLTRSKVQILFESNYSPKNLKNFIKKFDKKNFGINYDTGNSASFDYDSTNEFKQYGKYIKNIHIKDRVCNGKTIRLGKGNADFKKIFKNIYRIKYNNLLIFQTARSLKKNDDINELKINLNFIKKIVL